jgi:hypothetical protein
MSLRVVSLFAFSACGFQHRALDQAGATVQYTAVVSADDVEVPTQMVFFEEQGQRRLFIWKREE